MNFLHQVFRKLCYQTYTHADAQTDILTWLRHWNYISCHFMGSHKL